MNNRRTSLGSISANQMNQLSSRVSMGPKESIAKPVAAPAARRTSMSMSAQPMSQLATNMLLSHPVTILSSQPSSQGQLQLQHQQMNTVPSSRKSSVGPARKSSIPAKASVGMNGTTRVEIFGSICLNRKLTILLKSLVEGLVN